MRKPVYGGIRNKLQREMHIWELVKSPSISYRNMQGKKTTTNFKKTLILLPRHFDCETAMVFASFSLLLYCDINLEKRNPCWERKRIRNSSLTSLQQLFWAQSETKKCFKNLRTLLFRLRPIDLQWKMKMHTPFWKSIEKTLMLLRAELYERVLFW